MSIKANSTIPPSVDASGNLLMNAGLIDRSASVQSPTTGFSITFQNNMATLILTPAGTLASGTITMPSAPADKQVVRFCSSQAITSLTVAANAGQSILNAPTSANPGVGFSWIYNLATTTWLRLS